MTPARDYDMRYGRNLVKTDSAEWPRYVVVSTPTAWKTAKSFLAREPAGLVFNEWLDRTHLEETAASLPDDAELAVGIGAGRALDHAKLVAERKGIPLVQVPTVVSTGAIIHSLCGDWAGRVIHGWAADVVAAADATAASVAVGVPAGDATVHQLVLKEGRTDVDAKAREVPQAAPAQPQRHGQGRH